jgi:hypothetical protein
MLSDGARVSSPVRTVAPVVLSPDIDSKNASVKLRPGNAISKGTVAIADMNTHASVTSRNPSRERNSRLWRCVAANRTAPTAMEMAAA